MGNSAHPLLPPSSFLLPGLHLVGPAGIPNTNLDKLAPIEVKDIIVAVVAPSQSSDVPLPSSCHQGLGTVYTRHFKDVNLSYWTLTYSKYINRQSGQWANTTTQQGGGGGGGVGGFLLLLTFFAAVVGANFLL